MIDLQWQKKRFYLCSEKAYLQYVSSGTRNIVLSSGTMNYIWNIWNLFWRNYFLLYMMGGYDINGNRIQRQNSYSMAQNKWLLRQFYDGRTVNGTPRNLPPHNEPTWGGYETIENILLNSGTSLPNTAYVLALLANYATDIKHFRTIRNGLVHLNRDKISEIKNTVVPYYRMAGAQKVVEILDATSIQTNQMCLRQLIDSMQGIMNNL